MHYSLEECWLPDTGLPPCTCAVNQWRSVVVIVVLSEGTKHARAAPTYFSVGKNFVGDPHQIPLNMVALRLT